MFITIALVATICTADIPNECEIDFEHTYQSSSLTDFKYDAETCFKILESYPVEQHTPDGKIIYRDCYSVHPDSGAEGQARMDSMLNDGENFLLKNEFVESE